MNNTRLPETVWSQLENLERRLKVLETAPRAAIASVTSFTSATIGTSETRSSASYGDLATVGPSLSVTVSASGRVLVLIGATVTPSVAVSAFTAYVGFSVASTSTNPGTTTVAADDARAAAAALDGSITNGTVLVPVLLEGLAPSSSPNDTTLTLKYRADGANTAAFANRFLLALPL